VRTLRCGPTISRLAFSLLLTIAVAAAAASQFLRIQRSSPIPRGRRSRCFISREQRSSLRSYPRSPS
jgi:hypothetical protein